MKTARREVASDASQGVLPFGHALRAKRLEKRFGLRQFAELVGVSPAYLSQIEQCNVAPPAIDRINRMAELLGEDPDEWVLRAGRLPDDISRIVSEQPAGLPELLRAVRGLKPEQVRKLGEDAERMKGRANWRPT